MSQCASTSSHQTPTFTVEITEQPFQTVRYRYKSERRLTYIFGASTSEQNTFFTIKIRGYIGLVNVVVFCVTNERPYKRYPSKFMGSNCQDGYFSCNYQITEETHIVEFRKLGFCCLRKTNEKHRKKKIDFNTLRLCVRVTPQDRHIRPVYVVSDPVYNKQKMPHLVICKLSHRKLRVDDNQKNIILLCKKVFKNDVKIRFVEMREDRIIWEAYGIFNPNDVHEQAAICFRPPEYYNKDITSRVKVFIQLQRISNNDFSRPHVFFYSPAKKIDQLTLNSSDHLVGVTNNFQSQHTTKSPGVSFNNSFLFSGSSNNLQSNTFAYTATTNTQNMSSAQTMSSQLTFNDGDHLAGAANNFQNEHPFESPGLSFHNSSLFLGASNNLQPNASHLGTCDYTATTNTQNISAGQSMSSQLTFNDSEQLVGVANNFQNAHPFESPDLSFNNSSLFF